MSEVRATKHQVGISATALNNATIRTPDIPDGSVIVSRGNAAAPGATLATFNADGTFAPAASPATADNSTKAATTAWSRFGLIVLMTAPGYIKFPAWLGGLIFQWGSTLVAGNSLVGVSWPLVFPSGCWGCLATVQGGAPSSGTALGCATSPTGMNLHNTSPSSNTIFWFAVGI